MTSKESGKCVRDRVRRLLVGVSTEERAAIEARAASVGMSVAAYLRVAALNQPLRSVADRDAVDALVRLHGELGQLRQALANQPAPQFQALVTQIALLRDQLATQAERLG